jgi:hypothetical protein
MADGVSELERQLNELSGALDLLFELREEFAVGGRSGRWLQT